MGEVVTDFILGCMVGFSIGYTLTTLLLCMPELSVYPLASCVGYVWFRIIKPIVKVVKKVLHGKKSS